MLNLDVVDEAISVINQDILFTDKFNRLKEHIVDRYNKEAVNISGVDLYEKMVSIVLDFAENRESKTVPAKFLIVYIFDKCDIFEKERS